MKVETKLARNANSEAELEWLGRSGVEYARWVLANSLLNPMQPYDSLDQPWATGSGWLGPTNNPIAEVENPFTLGHGTVSWKITDLESKFNINCPGTRSATGPAPGPHADGCRPRRSHPHCQLHPRLD